MKSLIAITTCNRLSDVKKYIWDYLYFVNQDSNFHFVLALDGKDKTYIDFCNGYEIPLIYSEEREGVGLSKNRIVKQFPDYDYYFFIDDDVELIDSSVFEKCIHLSTQMNIPHLCGNTNHVLFNQHKNKNFTVEYSMRGGGYFSFYTKEVLQKVGGWNTIFAKYKRFGHTEHSYRAYHQKLQEAPFIFAYEFSKMILVHNPVSVSKNNVSTNENELIQEEQDLIDSGSTYFPLETLSPFHFNQKSLGFNNVVNEFLKTNTKKYPLSEPNDRRKALGEHFALKINTKKNSHFKNLTLAIKSFVYSPMNNELKHALKNYFSKK